MNNQFWILMAFYAILSCFIMPLIGSIIVPGKKGLEWGFVGGSAFSVFLWFAVGKALVNF